MEWLEPAVTVATVLLDLKGDVPAECNIRIRGAHLVRTKIKIEVY